MSEPGRADPFAGDLDLSDFKPSPPRKPAAEKTAIREASEAHDFPSRRAAEAAAKPALRRRRTGRNVQFNIKATAETIARFTALADRRGVPFGELLEQLVADAQG
jgi:hypothetical protein